MKFKHNDIAINPILENKIEKNKSVRNGVFYDTIIKRAVILFYDYTFLPLSIRDLS